MYEAKKVTEEDILKRLARVRYRVERCLANDRHPDVEDLELLGKSRVRQTEHLRNELEIEAHCDAYGDWMSDGHDLHCEKDAFLYEGGAEEHAKLMAEHMALQPKEVVSKDFF